MKQGNGNWLLRDDTSILQASSSMVTIAHENAVPLDETITETDLQHCGDLEGISEYKQAAVHYITGFVAKKLREKLSCITCAGFDDRRSCSPLYCPEGPRWSL